MHECEFRFDREFIRRALRRDHFWWSLYRILFFLGIMALLGVYYGFGIFRNSTILGIVGLGLAFLIALGFRIYRKSIDITLQVLERQSPDRSIRLVADNDYIALHFQEAHQRYRWQDLRRLWRYPDVWLIEIVKNQSIPVPPDQVPPQMRDFITERCRAAGLKVDQLL